eukprot:s3664_g8.t2
MQANAEVWNQDKGIPFNYDTKSLKLTPPRRPKRAMERRKSMWLKYSLDNMHKRPRNCYRLARQAVMKALKRKYRSRRLFKRERRQLWIQRVGNNSKLHGIPYNQFICKLKEANININRKILSQLGIYDRAVFTNVVQDFSMGRNANDFPASSHKVCVPFLGRGIFAVKYRIKWLSCDVHVRFDRAGSHKVLVAVLGRGIFAVNYRIKWLSCDVHVRFDCAGSHKVLVAVLGRGIFAVNYRIKWLS